MRFIVLLVLIFLLIGLNVVSAADSSADSLNLTDNLESTTINSVDTVESISVDDSSADLESVSNEETETIMEEETFETIDSNEANTKSKLGAGDKTVHTVTAANYSKYFDSKGNLINSLVKANDTINLSGNFSNKNFIITIPLTVTSTESNAFLKNSHVFFYNVTNKDFKYDAIVSNLNIESGSINTSAIWLNNSNHVKVFNNTIFTYGSNNMPITLDNGTCDCLVYNNSLRTIVPINETEFISNGQAENSTENNSWQHSGISFRDSFRNSILDNEIVVENSYGIYLCFGKNYAADGGLSNHNIIRNNTIRATSLTPTFWSGGVYITGSYNIIENNTIIGLYRGVISEGNPNNTIVGNVIYNITGIDDNNGKGGDYAIVSSKGCLIANNTIINTDVFGAAILVAEDCTVYGNMIQIVSNGSGIEIGSKNGNNSKVYNNTVDFISGNGIFINGEPYNVEIYSNILNSLSYIGAPEGSGVGLGINARYQSRFKRPYNVSIFDNVIYTQNNFAINIAQLSTESYLCENNDVGGKGIIYPMSVIYIPTFGNGSVYEVNEKNYDQFFTSDGLTDIVLDGDFLIFTGNFTPKHKLTLDKSVSIISKNAKLYNTTIFVNAPNCVVENFTIINNGSTEDNCNLWGIYVFETDNATLMGNNITVWDMNTSYGIYLCDSMNNTVRNNRISCNGTNLVFGLLNYEVYNTFYRNNKINATGTAELYPYYDTICIDGVHSIGELSKTYGVIFDFSSDNRFIHNRIEVRSNIKKYQEAYNPSVNILIGLYIYYSSHRNQIIDNKIILRGHDPFLYGMGISGDDTSKSVTQAWNNTLSNNTIDIKADYFATGIILRHNSMNTQVSKNVLKLNSLNYTYGLTLEISGGAKVIENTFKLTGRAGIYATELYSSWSNTISKNKYYVNGSFSEVGLYGSSGNKITKNDFYILSSKKYPPCAGNQHPDSVTLIPTGILLEEGSNGNIISNNRIRTNGNAAITVRGSYGNTISNNKLYSKNGGGNAAVDDDTGMNNIFGNTGSKFKDPFERANGNSGGNVKGGDNPNKGSSSRSGSDDSSGASSFGDAVFNFLANALSSASDGAGDAGSGLLGEGEDLLASELEEIASKSISNGMYVPIAALMLVLVFCFSFLNSKDEEEE